MHHISNFSQFSFLLENTTAPSKKFPCVPQKVLPFVEYVSQNTEELKKKLGIDLSTLLLLTKASLGIIGRETKFGENWKVSDLAFEIARDELKLGPLIDWTFQKINTTSGKKLSKSLGIAQITSDFWSKYGLEQKIGPYDKSFNSKDQGLAVLYGLAERYKSALQTGLKKEPSVNPVLQKYGVIKGIAGTGNNALDLSILGHNMGDEVITQWCKTSHPLYAAPKNGKSKYSPFNSQESFNPKSKLLVKVQDKNLKKFPGELEVKMDELIPNFFPNLKGPSHTAIGYVETVSKFMKQFSCLDNLGSK